MKTAMKKLTTSIALGAVCLSLGAGTAFAEEEKPTADLTVGAYSQYIWRGFEFSQDSIVLQPSITVGYKGFSANLWGNLDTDYYATDTNEFNETDLTLAYDWDMGPVAMTAGYIYYSLDSVPDTQEVFLSASLDTLLSPTLTVYRDYDNLAGWYVTLGVSHSVPLTGDIALDLGAQISYLSADEGSSYGEVKNGVEDSTDSYSALHDGTLSASVTVPVAQYITVTPSVSYIFPLSSDASDLMEVRSVDGNDDNFFVGGVSVSLSF